MLALFGFVVCWHFGTLMLVSHGGLRDLFVL